VDYRVTIGEREETLRIEEGPGPGRYRVTVGDRSFDVDAVRVGGGTTLSLLIDSRSREAEVEPENGAYHVQLQARSYEVFLQDEVLAAAGRRPRQAPATGRQEVASPMPGLVVAVKAEVGRRIAAGEPLVIVEAMKMQNELGAAIDGVVKEIRVRVGQAVSAGQVLVVIDAGTR
jgi:biotin carboxyl carrier protein